MVKPTDDEIIAQLARYNTMMTYHLANWLRSNHKDLDTAFVLRRLKVMEKAGKVKRVPSTYATQLCWAVTPAPEGQP